VLPQIQLGNRSFASGLLLRRAAVPRVHEIKHDGHRLLAFLNHKRVILRNRNGYDATRRYAAVASMVEKLPARSAIVDGEVAVPE
jgi:ATP-dependent DNA ligase